jgi:lambda repressor-like predicted transcriptional regulator
MMNIIDNEIEKSAALVGAKFLQAYLECSNEIQAGVRDMLAIIADPETDADDRDMTLHTLSDALFPNPHDGKLGMDLEESEGLGAMYSPDMREALEDMDREEATFAKKVASLLKERGMSQEELAKRIGVGQPAISNMLNRKCRPQRATVLRVAEALGVLPADLWPPLAS